jgi:hypothetical protein
VHWLIALKPHQPLARLTARNAANPSNKNAAKQFQELNIAASAQRGLLIVNGLITGVSNMAGYTSKECPGCGRFLSLPPKSVCRNCSNAIREYPQLKAAENVRMSEYKIGLVAPVPGLICNYKTAKEFGKVMSEFLRANGSLPLEQLKVYANDFKYRSDESCHFPNDASYQEYEQNILMLMTQEQRSLYTMLMYRMADVIREAEQVGQEKGQNLLFQLNDGSISLNDFNEKLAKAQQRSKF